MSGNPNMTFDEVVNGRRSIRGYLDKPVPRDLIEEVLALAMRSPSSMNTQPTISTSSPASRSTGSARAIPSVSSPARRTAAIRRGEPWRAHRERQIGCAVQLFEAMGIERDDKDARQDWVLRGFRQFDAPVCVIVTYDKELSGSDDTPFDCGAVTTALVCGMVARARLRHQFARDHAKPGCARTCGPPGRSGHHEGRRDALAGRGLPRQPGQDHPPRGGRSRALRRVRLTASQPRSCRGVDRCDTVQGWRISAGFRPLQHARAVGPAFHASHRAPARPFHRALFGERIVDLAVQPRLDAGMADIFLARRRGVGQLVGAPARPTDRPGEIVGGLYCHFGEQFVEPLGTMHCARILVDPPVEPPEMRERVACIVLAKVATCSPRP